MRFIVDVLTTVKGNSSIQQIGQCSTGNFYIMLSYHLLDESDVVTFEENTT